MIIAIIPARGGSKGVPGKNIRNLGGIPLLGHSIRHAMESALVNEVYVSTDSEEIAAIAREFGASVIERPAELANDAASSESALLQALDTLAENRPDPELVVFLQGTSPFRRPDDIDAAIRRLRDTGADSLVSVAPSHRFLWQEGDGGYAESLNYDYGNRPRRQDMRPQYVENGSIYVFSPELLRQKQNRLGGKVCLYVMDEVTALEIDTPLDFQVAEVIFEDWLQ